jgi:N-methylhydantoinase B
MTKDAARGRDTIYMSLVHERLLAVAEDVGHILIRGAFSSNIKERRDCSTAIFDAAGRLVAQADHMPIHIGSLLWGTRAILARYRPEEIRDGDAFVMNDPYLAGGTHLPDISVISPVFFDETLRFFVGNIAHHADVGGPVPGSVSGSSPSIFSEGIRLPPIRIARNGVADDDVIGLIAHNTREPMERVLDLKTQLGANQRGADLMAAVVGDYGIDRVEWAMQAIIDYTGKRVRAALSRLPDGVYREERFLDDDGAGSEPVPLVAAATISGEHLLLDFTGSGAEAGGAVNLSASSLEATVAYCIKALIDPGVPANSGLLDAVEIRVPQGSILNPRAPAAVAARAVTSNRLAGAIFGAIGQALPACKRMASSNDSTSLLVLAGADPERGSTYVYPESMGGGAGASSGADGMDAVHVHTVNSTNLPVEVLETEYPLRCEEYALVPDSGGVGQYRGGLGIARDIRVLVAGTALTVRSDGHLFPAPGAAGGAASSTTRIRHFAADGTETELPSKTSLTLGAGDRVRVETLGGGGYGPAETRARERVVADIVDGKVSRTTAEEAYGAERIAVALGEAEPEG